MEPFTWKQLFKLSDFCFQKFSDSTKPTGTESMMKQNLRKPRIHLPESLNEKKKAKWDFQVKKETFLAMLLLFLLLSNERRQSEKLFKSRSEPKEHFFAP